MYEIQYRCLYREYWYDAGVVDNPQQAIQAAVGIAAQRGTLARVIWDSGAVVVDGQGNVYQM